MTHNVFLSKIFKKKAINPARGKLTLASHYLTRSKYIELCRAIVPSEGPS